MIEELLAHAKDCFEVNVPVQGSSTVGAHVRQMERQKVRKGSVIDEEDNAKLPFELSFIWSVFLELNAARGSNGFSPGPVSFVDISCWCWLKGVELFSYEINILRDLDVVWMEVYHAGLSRAKPTDQK